MVWFVTLSVMISGTTMSEISLTFSQSRNPNIDMSSLRELVLDVIWNNFFNRGPSSHIVFSQISSMRMVRSVARLRDSMKFLGVVSEVNFLILIGSGSDPTFGSKVIWSRIFVGINSRFP